jgi:hypothetical protein
LNIYRKKNEKEKILRGNILGIICFANLYPVYSKFVPIAFNSSPILSYHNIISINLIPMATKDAKKSEPVANPDDFTLEESMKSLTKKTDDILSAVKKINTQQGKLRHKKDPEAPKKARTAWVFFNAEKLASFVKDHPAFTGDRASKMKELSNEWKTMSDQTKQKYKDQETKDKERYNKELALYNEKKGKEEPIAQKKKAPTPKKEATKKAPAKKEATKKAPAKTANKIGDSADQPAPAKPAKKPEDADDEEEDDLDIDLDSKN